MPFLFNLFAEALYWVFKRHFYLIITFFTLVYYLDDFIFILYLDTSYAPVVYVYNFIIILLSFPLNPTKDSYSTVLDIPSYYINTNTFFLSFSPAKQIVL
jgi:hypothetical protein